MNEKGDTYPPDKIINEVIESKLELYGNIEDEFVTALRQIKERLGLPESAKVIYPGSSTHVGVARVFGKENVVHIDPDQAVCQLLQESGYDAAQVSLENYKTEKAADLMVALNSYGNPTPEMIAELVKPTGYIISNNYTGWATELNKLKSQLELQLGLFPSYHDPNAQLLNTAELPSNATELVHNYYNIERSGQLTPGTAESHNYEDSDPLYPDALFIFQRK